MELEEEEEEEKEEEGVEYFDLQEERGAAPLRV